MRTVIWALIEILKVAQRIEYKLDILIRLNRRNGNLPWVPLMSNLDTDPVTMKPIKYTSVQLLDYGIEVPIRESEDKPQVSEALKHSIGD